MKVYKYRGQQFLERDLSTLASDKIYSAPIDTLNDPFEVRILVDENGLSVGRGLSGILSVEYAKSLCSADAEILRSVRAFHETSRSSGIYSLSQSPADELLWAYYGDSHRGFCIEYDLPKLLEYDLHNEAVVHVEYAEHIPTISTLDFVRILQKDVSVWTKFVGTKSRRWAHEREIRIVTARTGLIDYDFRALTGIHFGFRCSANVRDTVMATLKGRGIAYFEVRPVENTYSLESVRLEDPSGGGVTYRARTAPVDLDLLGRVKSATGHSKFLERAIEIVRRDPYCERVFHADLSVTRGTPGEPAYCVHYERSDGAPRTRHFFQRELQGG